MDLFESALHTIDLFGRPVIINFSGKEKFKSKFGGACSIVFMVFVVWALYNGSRDLFTRENPKIVTSEQYFADPTGLNVTIDSFPFGVGYMTPSDLPIEDLREIPYIDESIYTINFNYGMYRKIYNPDGSWIRDYKEVVLDKEICTPSHFGALADDFAKYQLNATYCIAKNQTEIDEVRVEGIYSSDRYEYLFITLDKCNNATANPKGIECKPPELINTFMTGAYFAVLYPNMVINPANYSELATRFRQMYYTMVSPINYQEISFYLEHVELQTDSGWLVPDLDKQNYIKTERTDKDLQFLPNLEGHICTVYIEASHIQNNYLRSYKTIANVLAEVGGLANVALAILLFISTPYLKFQYYLSLVNEVFDVHLSKPKKDNSGNKKSKNKKRGKGSKNINSQDDNDKNYDIEMAKSQYVKREQGKSSQTNEIFYSRGQTITRPLTNKIEKLNSDADWKHLNNDKEPEPFSPQGSPINQIDQEKKPTPKNTLAINTLTDNYTERSQKYVEPQISYQNESRRDSQKERGSLLPKNFGISRFASVGTKQDSKTDKDAQGLSPSYMPLEVMSPLSQQGEKTLALPLDPNMVVKEDPELDFAPKMILSKSSSMHEVDSGPSPQYEFPKRRNSQKTLTNNSNMLDLAQVGKQNTKFSFIGDKPEIFKIGRKEYNYGDPSLISSADDEDGYPPCDEEQKEDKDPNIFQKDDLETIGVKDKAEKDNNEKYTFIGEGRRPYPSSNTAQIIKFKEAGKLHISFWEYLLSSFSRSKLLKHKMETASEGIRNIDTRLDLIGIMKKLREIDKLKAILLDLDQATLFNNLPKPELKLKESIQQTSSFSQRLLRNPAFIDKNQRASILFDSYSRLETKGKKTKIDYRLMSIFSEPPQSLISD